jgi:hypothetical protein
VTNPASDCGGLTIAKCHIFLLPVLSDMSMLTLPTKLRVAVKLLKVKAVLALNVLSTP